MGADGIEDAPFVDPAQVFPRIRGPFEVNAWDIEEQGEECPRGEANNQRPEARCRRLDVGGREAEIGVGSHLVCGPGLWRVG
jgi:hypothetical protein